MSFKNSETSNAHRLLLNLKDKINLKRSDVLLYEGFELPDESYSVSGIQYYFEYILRNMKKRLMIC